MEVHPFLQFCITIGSFYVLGIQQTQIAIQVQSFFYD